MATHKLELISLELDHLEEVVPLNLLQPLAVALQVLYFIHQASCSCVLLEALQSRLDKLQAFSQSVFPLLSEMVGGEGCSGMVFGLIERPARVDINLIEGVILLGFFEGLLKRLHPVDELDLRHIYFVLLEEAVAVAVAPELPQENSAFHSVRIHLNITSLTPSTSPTTFLFSFFS